MKKIALIGLYSIPNMGDVILCETAEYLAKSIDSEIDVRRIDVSPRYKRDYHGLDYFKYIIARIMKKIGDKYFKYENNSSFRYRYEYFYWWLRLNRYYKRMLNGVDAIIFAGGGFLKFRTQGLNYYVEQISKIAEKNNIPVMMNGVGIEGYDENDIRCQKLKKAINKNCMKVITTRDDVETLQDKYVTNKKIKTARVGDVALYTPQCYDISRNAEKDRTVIGINVIRGKVYQDYGNHASPEQLKTFYKELITKADERGMEWILFSNGMKGDQKFGEEILSELGKPVTENLLPAPKVSMDMLDMIRGFKCVFGARLHACITAYSLDVPVVGLIWNEKTRVFADLIKKPQNFFEEVEMDADKILDIIKINIDSSYDKEIRNDLKELTKKYMKTFFELL